jgi:hypothetical protein
MKLVITCGNCESSHALDPFYWYLSSLRSYHGGWLAPKIYYLGGAGCVKVNGVRIAGASGIYNRGHDQLGESQYPYNMLNNTG